MKNQTCCFTGHRIIPADEYAAIKARLIKEVTALVDEGVVYFGAGGAVGFDTLAALIILELKQKFPHIRLILVLPCKDQTKPWNDEDKNIYNRILNNSDKVVYMSERYYRGCMRARNRYLVENSGICVCYLTKSKGGTAYTVDFAREKGLKIINLA